jgi:hypothetical protein
MSSPARIVCIPSADREFGTEVRGVADRIPGGLALDDALAWFTVELHRAFPTATVREQDSLAHVEGEPPVWYVTRRFHSFRIDATIWVPLPPSDAYRVYVDQMVEWQTSVELKRRQRTSMGIAEYDATYSFMGTRYGGVLRIMTATPGRSVSVEAQGSGITVWYVTSFHPERDGERDGTEVRVRGDYELPDSIFARVADRLFIERTIGRDIDRANESYRTYCSKITPAG